MSPKLARSSTREDSSPPRARDGRRPPSIAPGDTVRLGPTCGLWPGARALIGAVVDPDGLLVAAGGLPQGNDDGEDGSWLSHLEAHYGPDLELVLTPRLARQNPLGRVAVELGYQVWVAPSHLVSLVASAAWYKPSPRQLATVLARLPLTRATRAALRQLPLAPGPRQLRLL